MSQNSFFILALNADQQWLEIDATEPVQQRAADWYVFAHRGSTLHPQLASVLRARGNNRPDVDIFYGDEVLVGGPDKRPIYLCKPSFDRTQLLAQDYIGLPIAVRREAMLKLGGPEENAASAQIYNLLLRAMVMGLQIDRITEVLAINPFNYAPASAADRLLVLRRALPELHADCHVVPGLIDTTFQICRIFRDFPEVTLVIPTCQSLCPIDDGSSLRRPMILNLLDSLCQTDWPTDRLRVMIGDDVADGEAYEAGSWPFQLQRIITARQTGESFNYARKINMLWHAARTEHLVIMNDDLLVRGKGWLRSLMTFAMDDGVGGVGARLLYPDGTIQHAGMPAGVLGPCTHAFIGIPATRPTYQNWAVVHREWSMVTGALFATRRSVLEQVNGLDERFSLNFNDVDLCLRLRLLGYRIVYTPHAELIHLESASRGKQPSPGDQTALFMEKWADFLDNDPAYHPRLTRSTPDIQPLPNSYDWWNSTSAAVPSKQFG